MLEFIEIESPPLDRAQWKRNKRFERQHNVIAENPQMVSTIATGASLRAELKRMTRRAHERAERRWTSGGAFANRMDYDAWLGRMHEVHRRIGESAACASGWGPGLTLETDRVQCLLRDLDRSSIATEHQCHQSPSAAWGVLYALNGSALGATVLLRGTLAQTGWPTRYLSTMQAFARSGALAVFFRELDQRCTDREAALDGAISVFEAIAA